MSPAAISALAALLVEAVQAGTSIASILTQVKANERVTPEMWAAIKADVTRAEAFWET